MVEFWGFLLSAMLESRTARGFCDWIAVSAFNISHGLLGPVSYNHQLISFKSFSCPLFMFWCRCCVAVWHDTWWICMHVVSVGLRWGLKEMKTLYSMKNKQTSLLDLFTIELVKHFYTLPQPTKSLLVSDMLFDLSWNDCVHFVAIHSRLATQCIGHPSENGTSVV